MDNKTLFALIAAYLIGAIPFGWLIAYSQGLGDIRQHGSGNIGATNVLRTVGKWAGVATLLLDMAKGAVPILLAKQFFGTSPGLLASIALCVFLGHLYPIYLGFQGGKGVATGLGVFLGWLPVVGILALLTWLGVAWQSRLSSLAALVSFALLPIYLFVLGADLPALGAAALIALFIFWRHRTNIVRIHQGTEPRIGQKG